ncbi:MAG: hypothetical protein K0R67_3937 [Paenibacillus sp.]|nr:hypothetical protein [Paenibacillus sp.]
MQESTARGALFFMSTEACRNTGRLLRIKEQRRGGQLTERKMKGAVYRFVWLLEAR